MYLEIIKYTLRTIDGKNTFKDVVTQSNNDIDTIPIKFNWTTCELKNAIWMTTLIFDETDKIRKPGELLKNGVLKKYTKSLENQRNDFLESLNVIRLRDIPHPNP
jgi:hypothetical protein